MLDAAWKWLPKTAIFVNAQQGYVFYLNDAEADGEQQASSYPAAGHGRLARPADREDVRRPGARLHERLLLGRRLDRRILGQHLRRARVHAAPDDAQPRSWSGYRHDFTNAVIASFSYNETVYASYVQQIAGRLALDIFGPLRAPQLRRALRRPDADGDRHAPTTSSRWARRSTTSSATGSTSASATRCSSNSSNIAERVEYLKQQMFVRLGLTY